MSPKFNQWISARQAEIDWKKIDRGNGDEIRTLADLLRQPQFTVILVNMNHYVNEYGKWRSEGNIVSTSEELYEHMKTTKQTGVVRKR